jgi:tRNA (cmo5U34)-methyltransferase
MTEWEWDPDTYLAEMAAEIPGYEELQEAVVAATADLRATRVLELGTGTGETALRILANQPEVDWVGIDASEPMLARARERLPDADLRLQRLEDKLPPGPFDLVVSALASTTSTVRGNRTCSRASAACCERAACSCSATSSFLRRVKRGRSTSTG